MKTLNNASRSKPSIRLCFWYYPKFVLRFLVDKLYAGMWLTYIYLPEAPTWLEWKRIFWFLQPLDCWKMHFPKPGKYFIINKSKTPSSPHPLIFTWLLAESQPRKFFQKNRHPGKNWKNHIYAPTVLKHSSRSRWFYMKLWSKAFLQKLKWSFSWLRRNMTIPVLIFWTYITYIF